MFEEGPRNIMILDGSEGYPIWITPQPGPYTTGVVGDDSNGDGIPEIFAGTASNLFYALDGLSGYPIWSTQPGGGTFKIIIIDDVGGGDESDLFVTTGGGIVVLDPQNGEEIWQIDHHGEGVQAVNVGVLNNHESEQVVIGRANGEINGFAAEDGELLWTRNIGSTPIVMRVIQDLNGDGNPEVGIGTSGNLLTLIAGAGEEARWSYSEGGEARWVQCIGQVQDVEGNWSVEVVACTRNGVIRMFTGGLEAENSLNRRITPVFPNAYSISSAYPNPFNSSLRLTFELPENIKIPARIFDMLGREVHRIILTPSNGHAQAVWQPEGSTASGSYIISIDNTSATTRVMYVK
jgi:outer membrane protein assembly factor BamB